MKNNGTFSLFETNANGNHGKVELAHVMTFHCTSVMHGLKRDLEHVEEIADAYRNILP